ncbi:hypothetical protein [Alkalihalobacillus deserti]|uniref:hypothetical protein n=1 Tax=Alkalihalobacillus deserti TaxID=2879466 RepID=UPI001D1490C1|nr:hypothetical protein [Alkalihalobacillus deserti]
MSCGLTKKTIEQAEIPKVVKSAQREQINHEQKREHEQQQQVQKCLVLVEEYLLRLAI